MPALVPKCWIWTFKIIPDIWLLSDQKKTSLHFTVYRCIYSNRDRFSFMQRCWDSVGCKSNISPSWDSVARAFWEIIYFFKYSINAIKRESKWGNNVCFPINDAPKTLENPGFWVNSYFLGTKSRVIFSKNGSIVNEWNCSRNIYLVYCRSLFSEKSM